MGSRHEDAMRDGRCSADGYALPLHVLHCVVIIFASKPRCPVPCIRRADVSGACESRCRALFPNATPAEAFDHMMLRDGCRTSGHASAATISGCGRLSASGDLASGAAQAVAAAAAVAVVRVCQLNLFWERDRERERRADDGRRTTDRCAHPA